MSKLLIGSHRRFCRGGPDWKTNMKADSTRHRPGLAKPCLQQRFLRGPEGGLSPPRPLRWRRSSFAPQGSQVSTGGAVPAEPCAFSSHSSEHAGSCSTTALSSVKKVVSFLNKVVCPQYGINNTIVRKPADARDSVRCR